jgi:hypothetical protein
VIRRIQEIKAAKAKPGLKQAIEITMAKKAEQDEKVRNKLKTRVMALYEKEIAENLSEDEKKFTRIIL